MEKQVYKCCTLGEMSDASLLYPHHAHEEGRGGINCVCDLIKAIQIPLLTYYLAAATSL